VEPNKIDGIIKSNSLKLKIRLVLQKKIFQINVVNGRHTNKLNNDNGKV
jgi:hypothetical protein